MVAKIANTIEYASIPDNTGLIAAEAGAELAMEGRMCNVIRHRVSVHVEYLIELATGERKWIAESQS